MKFLGFLTLSAVALIAPLLAIGWNTTAALESPTALKSAVHQYWLSNRDALADAGKDFAASEARTLPSNNSAVWLWRVLAEFDHKHWKTLMDYVLPPRLLESTTDSLIDQWEAWWLAPDSQPRLIADLRPIKRNLSANSTRIADWILAQVPPCDLMQNAAWGKAMLLKNWRQAPLCLPAIGANSIKQSLRNALRSPNIPEQVDLLAKTGTSPQQLIRLKQEYNHFKRQLPLAGLITVALWLLGSLMMGRSLSGRIFAAGSSLLFTAGGMVLLGYAASPIAKFTIAYFAPSNLPSWAATALGNTIEFYIGLAFRPLITQGLILGVAGAVLLLLAALKK